MKSPLVIKDSDNCSLDVILTNIHRRELLYERSLTGKFINSFGREFDLIELNMGLIAQYNCSDRYLLYLKREQLLNPGKSTYTSNSIYEDSLRGNPLRIVILK